MQSRVVSEEMSAIEAERGVMGQLLQQQTHKLAEARPAPPARPHAPLPSTAPLLTCAPPSSSSSAAAAACSARRQVEKRQDEQAQQLASAQAEEERARAAALEASRMQEWTASALAALEREREVWAREKLALEGATSFGEARLLSARRPVALAAGPSGASAPWARPTASRGPGRSGALPPRTS